MSQPRIAMTQPHIFVSHSHQDNKFTARLVNDLKRAGADVWVDKSELDHGNFMQRIDEALRNCDWMVLVLTPPAISSPFVQMEVNAALLRVQQGKMRGVIPVMATTCPPDTIPALLNVLQRYDATHRYKAALADVLRVVGLSLTNVNDLLADAQVLLDQEQYAEAAQLLDRATRLAPENSDAWRNLSHAHIMLGQWQEAQTANDRALHIEPTDAWNWNQRSLVLSVVGQDDEALAAVGCALALNAELADVSSVWGQKGSILTSLRRYDDALAACDRALALDPNDDIVWDTKGNALRGLKRQEEAVAAYDRALAIDPKNAQARRNKGYSLRALARKAQAQEDEQRTQELVG